MTVIRQRVPLNVSKGTVAPMNAHKLVITARFASVCPACDLVISAGEEVLWSRGEKAVHRQCPPRARALRLVEPAPSPVEEVEEVDGWAAVAAAAARTAPVPVPVEDVAAAAPAAVVRAPESVTTTRSRVRGADFAFVRKPRQTVRSASSEELAWDVRRLRPRRGRLARFGLDLAPPRRDGRMIYERTADSATYIFATRDAAWAFMRACDAAGVSAGFPSLSSPRAHVPSARSVEVAIHSMSQRDLIDRLANGAEVIEYHFAGDHVAL